MRCPLYTYPGYACFQRNTGLAGFVPGIDNFLEIDPFISESCDYFCLDGVLYKDHLISISWDKSGKRYGHKGLQVLIDGQVAASSEKLEKLTVLKT